MKEFNDIEDLEQLLKPQCEFHASDKLKDEVIAKAKAEVRPRKVRLLPWLAAACVAGIIGLFLMPPEPTVSEAPTVAMVEKQVPQAEHHEKMTAETVRKASPKVAEKEAIQKEADETAHPFVEEPVVEHIEPTHEPAMLSETDVPITRPENLIDTPEDLAQIARHEKRAFISRMREQVEIAKAELMSESETQIEEN